MDEDYHSESAMRSKELSTLECCSCSNETNFQAGKSSSCDSECCSKSSLSFHMRNLEIMNSDSEDDLPSYGFHWNQDSKMCLESEDLMEPLNINDILSRRKEEINETFTNVHKLNILKEGLKLHSDNESSKVMKASDNDVKFILESAKLMEVVESTVKSKPHCVFIKPELSMRIFNFETLKLTCFIPQNIVKYTKLKHTKFDHLTMLSLGKMEIDKKLEEALTTLCLYLMSVHPVEGNVEMFFLFLCEEMSFRPCLSDFINIFRNWGCKLGALYRTVPEAYTGMHKAIGSEHPKSSMEVKEHNLHFVFRYLKHLLEINYLHTYNDLIEPLMRMFFDTRIYLSSLRRIVTEILIFLIKPIIYPSKISAVKNITLRDLHLKDLTLQQQVIICCNILRRSPFAIPLGYAALQQFLGCTNIKYSGHIELGEVYDLLVTNTSIIEESSYLDIYCYLQIIEIFLCYRKIVREDICEPEINHENWHDLFHDWSLRICNSDNCADPIYVKQKIAQVQYLLRMRKALTVRTYCVRNNYRQYNLNGSY